MEQTTQIMIAPATVSDNFEEVKAYILSTLAEYEGAVFVGEESIKMAKSIVAGLRKDQKALKDEIAERKRAYMEPWDRFMTQANEILALYDEPIGLIDGQVKAFVEKQKAEKRQLIEEIYNEIFPEEDRVYTLESMYNPKWENVTTTKKAITDDLKQIRAKIDADTQTIQAFRSESVEKALQMYLKDRDLQSAIAYMTSYENQRAEILKNQKAEEEDRIRREERAKIEAEQRLAIEQAKAIEQAQIDAKNEVLEGFIPEVTNEEAVEHIYSIKVTETERQTLEFYMNSIGIEWEVLS